MSDMDRYVCQAYTASAETTRCRICEPSAEELPGDYTNVLEAEPELDQVEEFSTNVLDQLDGLHDSDFT